MAVPCRDGQRSMDELGAAVGEDELADQGAQLHAAVAGDGLDGPVEAAGDLGDEAGLARSGWAGEEEAVATGVVQVGEHVAQQRVAEDVGLADRDLWMGVVGETEDFEPRSGLDAKGRRHIEALRAVMVSVSIGRGDTRPLLGSASPQGVCRVVGQKGRQSSDGSPIDGG